MKKYRFLFAIAFALFILFPFSVKAEEISTIEITGFNEPVVGEKPTFNASVAQDANYSILFEAWDGNNGTMIESVDNPSIINKIENFEENVVYTYYVYIKPKDGHVFADDVTATIDGINFDDYRIAGSTLVFEYQYGTAKKAVPKAEEYTVIFDANEGKFKNNQTTMTIDVWENGYEENLATPTRDGYKFKGYYTERIGGTKFELILAESGIDSDMTFYAQWEKNSAVSETIPEAQVQPPKTNDGIMDNILIGIIALIGAAGATIYLKKEIM